jgi:hypothetical protein
MYLKLAEAATYCGYSETQFKRFVETYSIPKYGPKKNRFRVEELDSFMDDPAGFAKKEAAPRRSRGAFTPVTV